MSPHNKDSIINGFYGAPSVLMVDAQLKNKKLHLLITIHKRAECLKVTPTVKAGNQDSGNRKKLLRLLKKGKTRQRDQTF